MAFNTFGFPLFVAVVVWCVMHAADGLESTTTYVDISSDHSTVSLSSNTDPLSDTTDPLSDTTDPLSDTTDPLSDSTLYPDISPNNVTENFTQTTSDNVFAKQNIYDPNNYLEKISTPIAAIVGIFGNTATIIALQGHPFSKIPSSSILISLAVSDTLTLSCIQFNKQFVMNLVGYDVRAMSRAGCKIFNFALRFAKTLSAWFVVLICLERFIAICFPFRTKFICTKANAIKGIAIVVSVGTFYCGVWTLNSEIDDSQCHPSFRTAASALRSKILLVIGSIVLGILPMIILLILTPIMCVTLYRQTRASRQMTSTRTPDVTKVSSMLISLCVTYVILQLPLIAGHNAASARGVNLYTTDYVPLLALNKIGTILEAINYSCNFFLYITCNRFFRRKVSAFLCCARYE